MIRNSHSRSRPDRSRRRFRLLRVTALTMVAGLMLVLGNGAAAQPLHSVRGIITDANRHRPLAGAHAWLIPSTGGNQIATSSDTAGRFAFTNVGPGGYLLRCSFLGYATIQFPVSVTRGDMDIGVVALPDSIIPLQETIILSRVPGTEIHGDSLMYTANAFKTDSDATAEELVTKLPGVSVDEEGSVQAQGEEVGQILVDGRAYFGSDPMLALRNLPAESIERIEIYDRQSDQAEFTGFDDGQTVKTMNIVTRRDKFHRTFGRTMGGYGSDDHYIGSGAMNFFGDQRRISLIGLSNNINQQNFSQQDLLGATGGNSNHLTGAGKGGGGMLGPARGGRTTVSSAAPMTFGESGSGFLVGRQTGITTAHSAGINDVDSLLQNFYFEGSYFYNRSDNHNPETLKRDYAIGIDTAVRYDQTTDARDDNINHRITMRGVWTIDSSSTVIITPHIYFQNNHSSGTLDGKNVTPGGLPSALSTNTTTSGADGFSFRNHIVMLHRFDVPGRTLSLDAGFGRNLRSSNRTIAAYLLFPPGSLGRPDSINHRSDISTGGYQASGSAVYTEPLGALSLIEISYSPSYTFSRAEDRSYNPDPLTGEYVVFNPRYSNTHETWYTVNRGGLAWRYHVPSFNLAAGIAFQSASLRSEQSFPRQVSVDKLYNNILPNAVMDIDLSARRNLRLEYVTATTAPTVTQLRDLVNKSNFLLVRTGNSDLKQSSSQSATLRYSGASIEDGTSLFIRGSGIHTSDYIGDALLYVSHDTVLARGIHLGRGARLLSPVNVDNYWNARASAMVGFPAGILQGTVTVGTGYSYSSIPGVVDRIVNRATVSTFSPECALSSTASENLDYSVSYSPHITSVRNSGYPQLDNSYVRHGVSARVRARFLDGFVARTELTNTMFTGIADTLDRNKAVWNISLGHKLFKGKRGEILVSVRNVFDQQTSFTRGADEAYQEDSSTILLGRYFLCSFSYTFR